MSPVNRRTAVKTAAVAGVALPGLAACAGDDESSTSPPEDETSSGDGTNGSGDSAGNGAGGSGGGAAPPAIKAADIPEGGGKIYEDLRVVVTQPSAGEFKAFSAICTHQGCTVTAVTSTIDCACHASSFSISDGSVQGGPAPSALSEKPVSVEGDVISLA
jgi:nitrite reductase/ring-hydroxylating ferredoxin subunit